MSTPTNSSNKANSLQSNLKAVKELINVSCQKAGRDIMDAPQLIAVSKGHDFAKIVQAYQLGQRHFGESYAQEFALKKALAKEHRLDNIVWHFIGAIQSNKIKIIKEADFIHSISSLRHAEILSRVLQKEVRVFLQVNLSISELRQGFLPNEVTQAFLRIKEMKNLRLIGLMTIAPLKPPRKPAYWFSEMADLKENLERLQIAKEVKLSMGMSDDFESAIAYGSNFVRIGSKIFGPRRP